MPQIPQYHEQVNVGGGNLGPGPLGGDHGASAIARLGEQLDQDAQRRRQAEVTRILTERTSELRLGSEQDFLSAQSNAADGAQGFTPTALKAFDDRRTTIAKSITDRDARNAFIEHADQAVRPELEARALQFENEQGVGTRLTKANESLARTTAAVELAPSSWLAAGAETLRNIDSIGLTPEAREQARAKATASIRYSAARGFAKLDPKTALAKIAKTDSGDPVFDSLSAPERHELEQYSKSRLAEVTADTVVAAYRQDARAGTRALLDLSKSDLPQDIKESAAGQVRQGVGLLHAERREQFGDEVTHLERSITQGTPAINAENTAAALYHRGAYTPEQYTNVLQAIDQARIESAKKGAELVTVDDAIRTGKRLDPKDEKIVKGVDLWFKNATKTNGIEPGTEEYTNAAASLAERTNILPPEAMSWARKTLLSGEPAMVIPAANAMQRFADAAPSAYAYFDDPNIKAMSSQVDSLVRAGVAPAKAVEIARANTFDIPKARQDALKATYTKGKFAADNAGKLQSHLNGDDAFETTFFGKAPAAPLAMQDEYGSLVRTYYDSTNGDIEQARELAWKDIRGTYGISTVNGAPQVLKYAPELVFPGIDPKVIRSDVDEVARSLGVTTPVRMVPSRSTGDTHGLMWELHTMDADGAEEVLLDEKNRPRQYAIPTDTGTYLKAQETAKQKAVSDAVAAREARRAALKVAEEDANFGGAL